MDNKRKALLLILSIIIVSVCTLVSYAYFTARVFGNSKENIVTSGSMRLEFNDGPRISASNFIPSQSVTKTFKVKNVGNLSTTYDIYFSEIVNTFVDTNDLVYIVSSINGCSNLDGSVVPSNIGDEAKMVAACPIDVNQEHEYTLTITFVDDNTNQDDNKGCEFSSRVSINEYKEEEDLKLVRSYIALANDYYENNKTSSLLGSNVIDELDISNKDEDDKIVVTKDGKVEAAIKKSNRCYRKNAINDEIQIYDESICQTSIDNYASNNGRLHVNGSNLYNENNEVFRLTGTSLEGNLVNLENVYSKESLNTLKNWGSNVLRIFISGSSCPYYVEQCYLGNEEEYTNYLYNAIDNAIDNDMYVILNWNPGSSDPNLTKASELFERVANHYPNSERIIYETWNEPNDSSMTWNTIRNYNNSVIPVIKNISPDAIVLASVPYSVDIYDTISSSMLAFDNIMYTMHAYANSMPDTLISNLKKANDNNIPLFISEWGAVAADSDAPYSEDRVFYAHSLEFARFLFNNDISYTYYSSEPSLWSLGFTKEGNWNEKLPNSVLRENGKFYKKIARNDFDYNVRVMIGDSTNKKLNYRSSEWKDKIISIEFKNVLEVPDNAVVTWDLSMIGDNSVIGYLISSEEDDRYHMIIAANGNINAPIDSHYLFAELSNLRTIDFTNFATKNIRNMNAMFFNDTSLLELDLTSFDLQDNRHYSSMCQNCSSLKSIKFNDTVTKVYGVDGMLYGCSSLEIVDLTNFDVTGDKLAYVFGESSKLKNINISTWNPTNVKNMNYMFRNLKNIEYIDMSSLNVNSTVSFTDTFLNFASVSKNATIKVKNDYVKNILQPLIPSGVNVNFITAYSSIDGGTTGDVSWSYNASTSTLDITGSGDMADYSESSLPPWYQYKDSIVNVNVGENVTKLGEYAFYNLYRVKNIRIDSITLKDLREDTINTGANYVMYNVGTASGATLTFGPKVTYVPRMFMQPASYSPPLKITKLVFEGNSNISIGKYGLANLSVDYLYVPSNVTSVKSMAFGYSKSYIIVLPDTINNINEGNVVNASHYLEKLVFGSSLMGIPEWTMANNENLTTIVIPHIEQPNMAGANTFSKNKINPVTIYGDSSTQEWVNNVIALSGQTNLIYKDINEYSSSITSNINISGSVGYNGSFTFNTNGNVKVYYTYTNNSGKTVRSNQLDVIKDGNTYTINNIKSDIYIEVE